MNFSVKPAIADCDSLIDFFKLWKVDENDLIVSNKYVIMPRLGMYTIPCDCIWQEDYGKGEPSDYIVNAMLEAIEGKQYNRIIAIGGGTVIDIAKLFVFGDNLDCEAIFSGGASLPRKRKLIIIPTTCGTGSEVTNISIIEFKKKQTKLGLAVPALYADEAVLIPSLLDSIPYEVFAASSIDALIHAMESYVSPKSNPFVKAMGRYAIELIITGYNNIDGQSLPKDMAPFLTASTMAGIAFGNAGCAAVHALSYPIGGLYHVPHGKANYMVFEAVFTAYREKGTDLSEVEAMLENILGKSDNVWANLFALLDKIMVRTPLAELGIDEQKCAEMAASVIENQQRLLSNNPVALNEEEIKGVYMRCLHS